MMLSVGPASFPTKRMNAVGKGLYPTAHVMMPPCWSCRSSGEEDGCELFPPRPTSEMFKKHADVVPVVWPERDEQAFLRGKAVCLP